jgi:hypothetical protein
VQQEEHQLPFVFEVGDRGVMAALNRAIVNMTGKSSILNITRMQAHGRAA